MLTIISCIEHNKNITYAGIGHSNTKYNMKYHIFGLGSLRDTICRFANVNHDLTTQLSIIITGLLTPNFACSIMVRNISKMADQS